jgi:broad-specificity NMP kinase
MYMTDLRRELKRVTKLLDAAEKTIINPKKIDDAFMKAYDQVKLLRIKKATLESRLKNYGKDNCVLPVYFPEI